LLDIAEWVLNVGVVRTMLGATIIGPLNKDKKLKMKQFIMMLLVTYYNFYKLTFSSPLGA